MAKSKYSSGSVERVVNSKVLVGLVNGAARVKSETAEIRGEYGASVKAAKESGLCPRSLRVILEADALDRNKGIAAREAFFRNIDLYRDKMIEEKRWESFVGDLAEQAEAAANGNVEDQPVPADDEQTATEAVVAENTAKLRRGIKKTEEGEPLH